MNKQRDKDPPRRGRGRSTATGSSAAPRGLGDRGRREQYIEDEERLEMTSCTTNAIPDTPQHLSEFDGRYMRDFEGEIIMTPPDDSRQHAVVNYFQELEAGGRGKGDQSLYSAQRFGH